MVSALVDIQPTIQAIELPANKMQIHCCPRILINGENKLCVGGILQEHVNEIGKSLKTWTSTYMASVPEEYRRLHGNRLQNQLRAFRVYHDLAHEDLCKLDCCHLVDEFEQTLKSMEDYKKAIDHTLNSTSNQLPEYMQRYILPFPGDWPTWYFTKKLIALTSINGTTGSHNYSSIIPEQGPFHVSLNANEDVIKIYHFFFARIYNEVFGTILPVKPKPFRVNMLLIGVLCGWVLIRDKVLDKFKLCKDTEYACIIHVLDEVLPLVFFQYGVVFRSGNLEHYRDVMFRFLLIFIIWNRHHYDRSTLSMLNDLCHQMKNFPSYYEFKRKWLALISEKKVEIWHSLLRFHIREHYSGTEIQNTAIALASSSTAKEFFNAFVRPYSRGHDSEKNLKLIAGKSAEALLNLFLKIGQNIGKSKKVLYITLYAAGGGNVLVLIRIIIILIFSYHKKLQEQVNQRENQNFILKHSTVPLIIKHYHCRTSSLMNTQEVFQTPRKHVTLPGVVSALRMKKSSDFLASIHTTDAALYKLVVSALIVRSH